MSGEDHDERSKLGHPCGQVDGHTFPVASDYLGNGEVSKWDHFITSRIPKDITSPCWVNDHPDYLSHFCWGVPLSGTVVVVFSIVQLWGSFFGGSSSGFIPHSPQWVLGKLWVFWVSCPADVGGIRSPL
jgi:hypothetical protein